MSRIAFLTLAACLGTALAVPAVDPLPPEKQYQAFIRAQAAELRKNDKAPETVEAWNTQEAELRKNLLAAWGGFPEKRCDLDPKQHCGLSLCNDLASLGWA